MGGFFSFHFTPCLGSTESLRRIGSLLLISGLLGILATEPQLLRPRSDLRHLFLSTERTSCVNHNKKFGAVWKYSNSNFKNEHF